MPPLQSHQSSRATVDAARTQSVQHWPDWRVTRRQIIAEISKQKLSTNPKDLATLLGNATQKSDYFAKLKEFFQDELEFSQKSESLILDSLKPVAAEIARLKKELQGSNPEATEANENLKAMLLEHPMAAIRLSQDTYLGKKFGDAARKQMDEISDRIQGLYDAIGHERAHILEEMRGQLGVDEIQRKYRLFCLLANSRVAQAEEAVVSAQEQVVPLEMEVSTLRQALADERQKTTDRDAATKSLLEEKDKRLVTLERAADHIRELNDLRKEKIKTLETQLTDTKVANDELLAVKDNALARMSASLDEKNAKIQSLDSKARALEANQKQSEGTIAGQAQELTNAREDAAATIGKLDADKRHLESTVTQLNEAVKSLQDQLSALTVAKDGAIQDLESKANGLQEDKDHLEARVSEQAQELTNAREDATATIERLDADNRHLESTVTELKDTVKSLQDQLSALTVAKDGAIQDLESTAKGLQADANATLGLRDERIRDLEGTVGERDNTVKSLQDQLSALKIEKDLEISGLKTALKTAEDDAEAAKNAQDLDFSNSMTAKNKEITELKKAANEEQSIKKDLLRRIEQMEQAAQAAQDNHSAAIAAKDREIEVQRTQAADAGKAANEGLLAKNRWIDSLQQRHKEEVTAKDAEITTLSSNADSMRQRLHDEATAKDSEIKRLESEAETMRQSQTAKDAEIEKRTRGLRSAVLMVATLIGDSIGMEATDSLVNDLELMSLKHPVEKAVIVNDLPLPSLRIAHVVQKSAVSHILHLAAATYHQRNMVEVIRNAQGVFEKAPELGRRTIWIELVIAELLENSITVENEVQDKLLRIIVMQAIQLIWSIDSDNVEQLVGWANTVKATVDEMSSPTLQFMVQQLLSSLANARTNLAFAWLSEYPAGADELNSSNSALAQGTRLIGEEPGLFFLVNAEGLTVFTANDVETVSCNIRPANAWEMKLIFQENASVKLDSISLSRNTTSGRTFDWVYKFLFAKSTMSSSPRNTTPAAHGSQSQLQAQRARSSTPTFNLLGSKFENIWMSAKRKELKDRLKELGTRRRTEPIPPNLARLPSTLPQPLQVDPEDPLALAWQRTLWYAFENFGRVGIAVEMHKKAANANRHASWDKVIADEASQKASILIMLMGLTDDVIRSLIRNTLPHDITQSTELADFVRHWMQKREAPSIYCMAIASDITPVLTVLGPRPRRDPGSWLSPDQTRQLVGKCKDYYTDAPNAQALNRAIDSWQRTVPWAERGRKWTSQSSAEWLRCFRDLYCTNIDPAKASTGWAKCPFEVGFAVNTVGRLRQHAINSKTNSLWAPVHAISRLPANVPNASGFGFPAPGQWELFPLFEDDEPYAQLAEIVGSLLCSSYWFEGGLNPVHAGSASLSRSVESWRQDDSRWNRQVITLANRLECAQYPDIEHDRFDTLRRALDALRSQKDDEAETARLKLKMQEQKEEENAVKEKWKKELRELGALNKRLEERESEVMSSSQDPALIDVLSLGRQYREADLISHLVSMDVRTFAGARKTMMEEQGISDSIRERVESLVEEEHEAAAQMLKVQWGTTSLPYRDHPDQSPPPPPVVSRSSGYRIERDARRDASSDAGSDVGSDVPSEMELGSEVEEMTGDEIESFDEDSLMQYLEPDESKVEGDLERG
ncbi:MAG: hypothetical protein Q9197_002001 [Variospora fuerteventurae]